MALQGSTGRESRGESGQRADERAQVASEAGNPCRGTDQQPGPWQPVQEQRPVEGVPAFQGNRDQITWMMATRIVQSQGGDRRPSPKANPFAAAAPGRRQDTQVHGPIGIDPPDPCFNCHAGAPRGIAIGLHRELLRGRQQIRDRRWMWR